MDKKIIDEIIGRMITDADFRKALSADPRKALTDAGYPIDENFLALFDPAQLNPLDAMVTAYENKFLGGQNVHAVINRDQSSAGAPPRTSGSGGSGGLGGPGGPMG